MMKSIKAILRSDKERYTVPRRVQDLIPIKRIWPNGIFLVGNNKFCQTFRFTDINYLVASREDQEKIRTLDSNPKAIEKIARERYFMKADDEDVFVLSDDEKPDLMTTDETAQ